MINHVWSVLCSTAIIDRDTNLVSLINILEEITVNDEPKAGGVLPIALDILSLWTRSNPGEPCRGRSRITLIGPDEKATNQIETEIDLTTHERLRARGHFEGLPASEPGINFFQVELQTEGREDWETVARIPLKIIFAKVK